MKKLLSILLLALLMCTVLFTTVACKEEPAPAPVPVTLEDPEPTEKCDPILPAGTGKAVPKTWSTDANGKTGLPSFVTDGSATNVTEALVNAVKSTPQSFFADTPKNIIYIIGDGMGVSHLNISEEYKGELIMNSLPYKTESLTDSYLKAPSTDKTSKTTTDSPAGGTQLLSGYKTRYGYISMDINGNSIKNLSQLAKENGWKTAVVTNDHIADATPACALINNTSRYHQDVIYYQELMENMPDLLMGWDWGMDSYFTGSTGTWATRMAKAEKDCLKDAIERECSNSSTMMTKLNNDGPVALLKSLTEAQKTAVLPYSLYYHVWSTDTDKSVAFETWLDSDLAAYCANLDSTYGNPEDNVKRFTDFTGVLDNNDYSKPILGSWTSDGNDYEAKKPNRGYLLHGSIGKKYPNFAEMVSYTIYQMDKMAEEGDTGFFAMIENTCTDGWGHSSNYDTKTIGVMNEVQCFDEGVAIAVKYVLEHPDTLLVVTADHETGGFLLKNGWQDDISKIKSSTTGHSSQNVPCIAFGAGADKFSAEKIGATHEGYVTGQIIGQLMGDANFGQPAGYPN